MTAAEPPSLEFKSKEEFRAVCHTLAMRMHYLNRTAMGEQNFPWEVAELLDGLGRAFEAFYDDRDTRPAFGDGWEPGTLNREERRAWLFKLIHEGK